MSSRIIMLAIAAVVFCAAVPAQAAYPDRPGTLLVGYAPGGSTDIIARLLAKSLSDQWKQTVVVENKAGASGMIAADSVVRAAPDGYTLLLGYTPEVSINKLVFKEMRYDPIHDLTPIALVASAPLVLASGPKLPARNWKALLALKGKETAIAYGSPGVGGQQHMAGEVLKRLTGLPLQHIPYRGTSLAVQDLVGGQIDLFFATTPPLLGNIHAGKIWPILVAGDKREKLLPDVPTAVELGVPDLQLTNWFGVFGPGQLPDPIAQKIGTDVMGILASKSFIEELEAKGLTPTPLQGEDFAGFIQDEMAKYQRIIQETGISQR